MEAHGAVIRAKAAGMINTSPRALARHQPVAGARVRRPAEESRTGTAVRCLFFGGGRVLEMFNMMGGPAPNLHATSCVSLQPRPVGQPACHSRNRSGPTLYWLLLYYYVVPSYCNHCAGARPLTHVMRETAPFVGVT